MESTRKAAKMAGEKHYFTGKPCKHGHIADRLTANGQCFECSRRVSDHKRAAARSKWKAKYDNSPEFRAAELERKRLWRIKKRKTDPAWKAKEQARKYASYKKRIAEDPELRARNNARASAYVMKRYNSEPGYRLGKAVSVCVMQSLKAKGISKRRRHWEELVPFTLAELRQHLEKQFKPGMTWENYGRVWHVDHKKPRSKCDTFEEAWRLQNLQPLFARENIIKSDHWPAAA